MSQSNFVLEYGPNNKGIYTQQFELIAKLLLQEGVNYQFELKPGDGHKKDLYLALGSQNLNLTHIIKNTDFKHVMMSQIDGEKYLAHLSKDPYKMPEIFNEIKKTITVGDSELNLTSYQYIVPESDADFPEAEGLMEYENVTFAEKVAINLYSQSSNPVNNFMFQNNLKYEVTNDLSIYFDEIKSNLLDTAFLASGLNHIHSTNGGLESYRGEGWGIPDELYEYREDLIESENPISKEHFFMSTSSNPDVAFGFSEESFIIFENSNGKDISPFSLYTGEDELLMLPTHVHWIHSQDEEDLKIFVAKPIDPLIVQDVIESEVDILKNLSDQYAQVEPHESSILTDFNQSLIQSLVSLSPINDDLIETHQNTFYG